MELLNGTLAVSDGRKVVLPETTFDSVVRVWEVPTEYRENGLFVAVVVPGQPPEIPACSQADAHYLGEVPYPAPEANKLEAMKAARLLDFNAACERELAALSGAYPAGELQSWPQQVSEAAALKADPPGAAPLLTAIAQQRGITVAELAARVEQKAAAFAEFSGAVIGKRQALEDRLALVTDIEQLGDIAW